MRVAMLLYNDFTGDLRVHKEARDLAAAGHEVRIVATASRPHLARHEAGEGYEVVRVPFSAAWRTDLRGPLDRTARRGPRSLAARMVNAVRRHPRRRRWVAERNRRRFGAEIIEPATEWRPDVIHAHDLDTLDFGVDLAARTGARLVYDSHELWRANNFILKQPQSVQDRWAQREIDGVPKADGIILTTEARAAQFRTWYPDTDPQIVMNCQDHGAIPRTRVLRDRLGLGDEVRILLYQGLIHPDRGLLVAFDALAHLPESVHVVAVGPGPERLAVAEAIHERGLTDRAHLLDEVPHDELAPITASADYGLCLIQNTSLSYYLSAPNKLFEFMRAGLPILASDFPEMTRVFSHGDLGEQIDPADAIALANAVERLDAQPDRRQAIAANGRRLVEERYNWGRQAEVLLRLYDRLAAGG